LKPTLVIDRLLTIGAALGWQLKVPSVGCARVLKRAHQNDEILEPDTRIRHQVPVNLEGWVSPPTAYQMDKQFSAGKSGDFRR
jgi:hypothetical protein